MIFVFTICILLSEFNNFAVRGANILALMPITSPSHYLWNSVLLHKLGELGHNMTILSVDIPKPNEKIPPNVHYIHLEEGYSFKNEGDVKLDIKDFINIGPFQSIKMFNEITTLLAEFLFKSKGLQTLLSYPDNFKFDLVIYDYSMGPVLLGFLHKFNYPPLVGMSPFHNPPITMDCMSSHYFPAYVPVHATMYRTEMNLWERLINTLLIIFDTIYRRLLITPKLDAMAQRYFPKDMPYLGELSKRTAIALVNSHPATNYVEPISPNVIEVGGMQIIDPKPLPNDLEEFMNTTKIGSVFVSFGTNMRSEDFTKEQVQKIVNAMAELPQYNFMWKFDVKYLKEKIPKNVLVRSFFPQRDILGHSKLKAFVTHCGALSKQEATWRGVPMICIPIFVDQQRNLQQSLQAGTAVEVDFSTMTTEILVEAIKKVVDDPQMRANVKTKAKQYSDRPMKPLDAAVWWVEYMLRNPNPYHLKSPAHKLNIFQANSLDCLLVILLVILLEFYVLMKLLLFILRFYMRTKKISPNPNKIKMN